MIINLRGIDKYDSNYTYKQLDKCTSKHRTNVREKNNGHMDGREIYNELYV